MDFFMANAPVWAVSVAAVVLIAASVLAWTSLSGLRQTGPDWEIVVKNMRIRLIMRMVICAGTGASLVLAAVQGYAVPWYLAILSALIAGMTVNLTREVTARLAGDPPNHQASQLPDDH